jgi:hypothetical protein
LQENQDAHADFVAEELTAGGLSVILDRWSLRAGLRLWVQIGEYISNPELTDGWLL